MDYRVAKGGCPERTGAFLRGSSRVTGSIVRPNCLVPRNQTFEIVTIIWSTGRRGNHAHYVRLESNYLKDKWRERSEPSPKGMHRRLKGPFFISRPFSSLKGQSAPRRPLSPRVMHSGASHGPGDRPAPQSLPDAPATSRLLNTTR